MDVSEQQLMDCSWGFGNSGCRGGYSWKALVWAKRHGVASSSSYGRYLAQVSILIFLCVESRKLTWKRRQVKLETVTLF